MENVERSVSDTSQFPGKISAAGILAFHRELQLLLQIAPPLNDAVPLALQSWHGLFPAFPAKIWFKSGESVRCLGEGGEADGTARRAPVSEVFGGACPTLESQTLLPLRWAGKILAVLELGISHDKIAPETLDSAGAMFAHFIADLRLLGKLDDLTEMLDHHLSELETIFEISPIGIILAPDTSCEKFRANPAAQRMLGVSSSEYYSKSSSQAHVLHFKVFAGGREIPPMELPVQRAAQRGEVTEEMKLDIVHDDGRVFHLYEYAFPLRNEGGEVRGALGFLVDVNPLFEAERQLQHKVEELAAADERKNHFLALLAHELRNPLSAIVTAAHTLNRPLPAEVQALARRSIRNQTTFMKRLVDDLWDVSRIGQQRLKLNLQPLDLKESVGSAVEVAEPLLEEKGQRLVLEMPLDPVLILGDPIRITQVLVNLLTNASKYSHERTEVSIRLRREGKTASIEVADQGIGIAKEFLPLIFDSFMQVEPESRGTRGGLGLGLCLVKSLTELHAGSVRAESAGLGRGSSFVVSLPLLDGNPSF